MRIGELGRRAGVNIQTLRFYEREGLLREPPRTPAGYRAYAMADLIWVNRIRTLQAHGFTLKDIRDLAELEPGLRSAAEQVDVCAAARPAILARARERLSSLDERLGDLARLKAQMERLIETLSDEADAACRLTLVV